MDFTDKTVLITGGSRGIGKATAQAFAAKGARVAITFHSNDEAALETVQSLEGDGHFAIRADIGYPDTVDHMVLTVIEEFGKIDILVNNAGIYEEHPLNESTYEKWQDAWFNILNVNLIGTSNVTYCVAHHMIKMGGGRIINVSSRGAFRGEPDFPAYGASKAGLNAMSQSLAKHLAPHRIYVMAVAPGFVETDMAKSMLESPEGINIKQQSPLNRVAKPEEVAHTILFLASEGAEFTTGTIVDVNGASYLRS